MSNNLTNQRIHPRDDADGGTTASNNVDQAQAGWFDDASGGDLHLSSCGITEVVGQGAPHASVTDDMDLDPRGGTNDIGADQCQ